ncbi:MAG: hypothetical protein CL886_07035 [Dehalococcoidia bacterium]|nr:hypothetical protein [Dehalococcoidia bacterium]
MFDVVTFDLWQTLLLDSLDKGNIRSEVRLSGTKDVLAKVGRRYSDSQMKQAYTECATQCRSIRDNHLDIAFNSQVKLFLNLLEPDLADLLEDEVFESVCAIYSDAFFVAPPALHPNCLEVLSEIKAMGLKIALISNTGMTPGVAFRRYLLEAGVFDFFEQTVFSDEELLSKPSPEIFHRSLRRVGSVSDRAIHVGDSINHDVIGAHLAGMAAVWIAGFSERGDLEATGSEPDVIVRDLAVVPNEISKMFGRERRIGLCP